MKRFTLIASACFALSLMFAACKKDYTCTCRLTAPLIGNEADTTIVIRYDDMKKKEAKAACNGSEETVKQLSAQLVQADCSL